MGVHIPVAVVIAGAAIIALVTRPGDAYRHSPVELTPLRSDVGFLPPDAADFALRWERGTDAADGAPDTPIVMTNPFGAYGLSAASVTPPDVAEATPPAEQWDVITIQRGQTLSGAFDALGMGPSQWLPLLQLDNDEIDRLERLREGDLLKVRRDGERLAELRLKIDEFKTLHIEQGPDGLEATTLTADIERRQAFAHGAIDSSLFLSGKAAGMSDRLIMSMVQVLAYDVDFAYDLREGDRFSVLYEELYRDGEKLRDGDILAVEFINRGRTVQAFRFEDDKGRASYYRPDGEAVKTAFLRNPLNVYRISSHFNLNRRHPVLNTIRAHRGTDYAAPHGTPIRSTGDGKVVFAGHQGGFGRVVIIRHGGTYQTKYAHMSRFRSGIRAGAHVRQGQVIGYVGSSGLATGPHLHFEFLVNGVHRDPLTVPLPRSEPVPKAQMTAFKAQTDAYIARLQSLRETFTADASGSTVAR
ncbi:peptidoglycan DD-metalloendopeptidase family protein [Algiphilus sp. NNCM1]|uniref:peptidoglycan DD-metalloendopeptidase family protein n=1 Tax=Algiphilus sp. TaxID=1872431 RepID=UPI001CA5FABF|nr:peptidoglycan DD-metalloendopeptidase family protein [Algiphilus sp.]MBY8964293.1 peptidoglycan DD-metalloendopeptidase family protein [Algiphilus acroporae]MCI5063415.1 peptidoglycan DD-metalloendopeptidase family protein [Algiphilus sp.]MCI5103071.1 peptidoglycan DD-metalloendopeptidase family protein [Algiphilus sp.]